MKILTQFILIFFLVVPSFGQVKVFRNLTIEDGLAQSDVTAIYQDKMGYMWFGTMHGLTRWDGLYYRNYDLIDGLIGAGINVISEDNTGNVLIGTDLGLSLIKNYKLKNIPFSEDIPAKDIYSFYTNSKNEIFIGLSRGLVKLVNGKIINPYKNSIIADKFVYAIAGSDRDEIFLAVQDIGLVKLVNDEFEIISNDSAFNSTWGNAFYTKENELIVSTRTGFARYKDGKLQIVDLVKKDDQLRIRKIFPGDDNNILIATSKGVIVYKDGETEIINYDNGLPGNSVASIWRDNNGVYYFGIWSEGVALYDGGRIFSLNQKTGFSSNRIYGIAEGYDGKIFNASIGGGIQVYDGKKVTVLSQETGFPSNQINDVRAFDENSIVAATNVGLVIWGKNGLKKIIDKDDGLRTNFVRTIKVDNDKTIYVVNAFGLFKIINGKVDYLEINKKIPNVRILDFLKIDDDSFILGTDNNGLVKIDGDSVRFITKNDGLSDNKVMGLYQRKDGTILVGTQGGLTVINNGRMKVYNTLNGLTDNTIYCVGEDDHNQIYLTTNRGVDILTFVDEDIQVRNISMKNGLAGNECNVRGLCKDSKGRMWFGTLKGSSCYDPLKDNVAKNPPEIKFTSVRLYDKIVDDFYENKELVFQHNENYLRFGFLGVNLTSPDQVKYQYRLTNVDPEWVESEFRFARYASLSNGAYKFEVRAKNEGGKWGEAKIVAFKILSPFYKSWWFITLSVIFVAGTITLFITMRVRQVIQFERLRTKLSADLHDNVGAGLTEISILSEVIAFAKDRNSEDVTRNLNLISRTARQLVDSMSDIVWLVNPKRDSLYDLIIRLEETYREIFNQKGISFQSKNLVSLESISLPMEYRQHLYLIFKEGINNSLKYSDCSKIYLDANVDGKKLEMHLSDDGKGFDLEKKYSGQGLKNMSERSNLINGVLKIDSDLGKGTKIAFEGRIAG